MAGFGLVPEKAAVPHLDEENKTGIFELKYNPWHDTEDGKFTFAGQGRNYGSSGGSFGGGGASGSWEPAPSKPKPKQPATVLERPSIDTKPAPKTQSGTVSKPSPKPVGRTAPSSRRASGIVKPVPDPKPADDQLGIAAAAAAAAKAVTAATAVVASNAAAAVAGVTPVAITQTVSAGGYNFDIDGLGRTGKIYGKIKHVPEQARSRRLQREAGRPDREPSDHGGHFIAREFGGPEIPENHFAQDAKINLGKYRRLENKWKRASKRGKVVEVEITPQYTGSSKRPDSLNVVYKINGKIRTKTIPNKTGG